MPASYVPNPNNVPIAITLFDDGSPPQASQLNPPYEAAIDLGAGGRARGIAGAISNWSANAVMPFAYTSPAYLAMLYDATFERWIAIYTGQTVSGSAFALNESLDGGLTFTTYASWAAGTGGGGQALAVTTNGGNMWVFADDGYSHFIDTVATQHDSHVAGLNATSACAFWHAPAGIYVTVGALQSGGSYAGKLGQLVPTASLTDASASLPSGFAAGTTVAGSFFVAQPAVAPEALVALSGATAGTDVARLLHVTGSGPTYTDVTPTATTGGNVITGVAYDDQNALWGILLYDGTTSKVFASSDLATWTRVAHFTGVKAIGLACVGGVWAATVPYGLASRHVARVQRSADVYYVFANGGEATGFSSTWHSGSCAVGGTGDPPLGLASSGSQLAVWSGLTAFISEQAGLG